MKKIILLKVISLFALLIFFNSCNNKKDDSSSVKKNFYFKVKVDGIEHTFNKSVFMHKSSFKLGTIMMTPNDGNGKSMAIAVASNDPGGVTGTITDEFNCVFIDQSQPGSAWDAERENRTVTISENNDNYIEGTFSFTGHDRKSNTTKEFTEGSFRARKPKKRK